MIEATTFEMVAAKIKVSPEDLTIAYAGLLAQRETLQLEAVQATLEPLGIGGKTGEVEEMASKVTKFEKYEVPIEQTLVHSCSLALASFAFTGRLGFAEARELVQQNIDEEGLQNSFNSELFIYEAYFAQENGDNKFALKLARKAIGFAMKSGIDNEIASARYTEGIMLFESKEYNLATKKLSILWKMYERDGVEEDPMMHRDHIKKQAILIMWRDAHVRLGNLEQACKVQEILYDVGYKAETAEEWREFILNNFPHYFGRS